MTHLMTMAAALASRPLVGSCKLVSCIHKRMARTLGVQSIAYDCCDNPTCCDQFELGWGNKGVISIEFW